jgi:EAL and modified HD-GYP domain-containing signal transduction protein
MMTHDGDKLMGAAEDFRMLGGELLASALEALRDIGTEPFAGSHDFFVPIGKYQLLIGMPLSIKIPPNNLICVIHKDTLTDNAAYAKLGLLKRRGYRLATDGMPRAISMETAVKVFDYVLLSYESDEFSEDFKDIRPFIFKTKLVITDVPNMEVFNKYSGARGVLLSGAFYSEPITKGLAEISPLKLNALQLLRQINDDEIDLGETADTIEHDPALSISLLRFINTMNPDRSRKIDSIRNAVAIMGQNEVKRWAMVAISVGIGEDRPSEITRLSLIRAKFAENLAPKFGLAIKSGSLFIMGLFSLLDVILQMKLEDAFDEVAVDDEIREALINKKGPLNEVMSLIRSYERADWHNATIIMVRNGIDVADLTKAFINSLYWFRKLLDAIDKEDPFADASIEPAEQ